jgi:predicted phage baseplate assembly protein
VGVESVVVESCTPAADGATASLTLAARLRAPGFDPRGLELLGNVVRATHGESAAQPLGSGDGRAPFQTYPLRRAPLTYVRTPVAAGARAELDVRVDDVRWTEVPDLNQAGSTDRVYALRHHEDGSTTVVFGDGLHGARPGSGVENVTAAYRVGLGLPGAVEPGQVSLLPRRPLGVRDVSNPAASRDWATAETLESARLNAPLRVRTLDRVVSVADHEDFARAFAGVGQARADGVWDSRTERVVLTVLGALPATVSDDLLADLATAIDAARVPSAPVDVLRGEVVGFGVQVNVAVDPAYDRRPVEDAVRAALAERFGPPGAMFGTVVTPASLLVAVHGVPGVQACTMPLVLIGAGAVDVLAGLPGRWEDGVRPAQLPVLVPDAVDVEAMAL